MVKIILTGNPLSMRGIYRYVCRGKFGNIYMSKRGKEILAGYKEEIAEQYNGDVLEEKIVMDIKFFFGDKRIRDIDNHHKLALDSMSGLIYKDDVQIVKLIAEKFYDKENPRIEIEIIIRPEVKPRTLFNK